MPGASGAKEAFIENGVGEFDDSRSGEVGFKRFQVVFSDLNQAVQRVALAVLIGKKALRSVGHLYESLADLRITGEAGRTNGLLPLGFEFPPGDKIGIHDDMNVWVPGVGG